MSKTINIQKSLRMGSNEIFTGENFENFLRNLPPMSDDEVANIKNSTIDILSNCVSSNYDEITFEQNTGLVLGYIQSGKTMSFTSLIALASDNRYRIVIVLAGTTNILLEQTIDRLGEDLDNKDEYVIIDKPDVSSVDRINRILTNPKRLRTIILPILKQHQHIEKIIRLFDSQQLRNILKKLGILIIDDEADQASLNGFARRNYKLSKKNNINEITDDDERSAFKYSTTYNKISNLKAILPIHSYIQYTATPQANLLLSHRDLLRPSWCQLLEPGSKYTGGKIFFNSKLDLIQEIEIENIKEKIDPEMPENLRHAYRVFLLESAILCYDFDGKNRKRDKINLTSMMIHADRLISINDYYLSWLKSYNTNLIEDLDKYEEETIEDFRLIFNDLSHKLSKYFEIFPDFDHVIEKVKYFVLDDIEINFVAGKDDFSKDDWNRCKHHVLVGGQKLDRGFTVKNLIVTYMPRTTKGKSNADTIEQRCRFFGYKKDYIEACKVYLPYDSIEEFEEYVKYEEHLRDYLKNYSLDEFYNNDRLMKLGILRPTSINKIPGELLRNDFNRFNYFQPDFEYKNKNDKLIDQFFKDVSYVGILKPNEKNNHQKDNIHSLFTTTNEKILELFEGIKFGSKREQLKKSQFEDILKDHNAKQKVWVIKIAGGRDDDGGRPRSLDNDGRIKSLASNYPPTFGDRNLLINASDYENYSKKYNNEPIVQIHYIKIRDNKNYPENLKKHIGSSLNVIAMIFPTNESKSFISIAYD